MKRLLNLFGLLLLALGLATAQTAVVTRNVNLRPDPSTNNTPIEKLTPDTQIQLLEPDRTNGFFHVKVDHHTGWVWGNNVHIQESKPTGAGGVAAPTGGAPATAISSDWSKPNPQD